MIKKYLSKVIFVFSLCSILGIFNFHQLHAQVTGPYEIKWLWVGSLRHWFSDVGAEIEYGRRGRGPSTTNTDQNDGLRWPAQFQFQDHECGKALWIGTTDFVDPNSGKPFPYKVVCFGRGALYSNTEIFPVAGKFKLIGRASSPIVIVDDVSASDLDLNDLNLASGDELDSNLPADRMIRTEVNTPIGITVYRRIFAYSQQYHDNYFIYEYIFKNTGYIDNKGTKINPPDTLTGVVFHFQNRLADGNDGYRGGWGHDGTSWGINTINDCVGQDVTRTLPSPNNFRAVFSYYGPHSEAPGVLDDIGYPCFINGSIMGGTHFVGEVVLHADTSPNDTTDDPTQPKTTRFMGSDNDAQGVNELSPTNLDLMTRKYAFMTAGHPQTHANQLGKDINGWPTRTANNWVGPNGADRGGFSSAQGFGPYDLNPEDSIRIVIAEAVAGINRDKNKEIMRNWWPWYQAGRTGGGPYTLPDGSTTPDGNVYKNTWVFTGKDSLFQSFRRALANYHLQLHGNHIPEPPPPPDKFVVTSGGNKIMLSWVGTTAELWPNFDGYRIYRGEGRQDTTYDQIFSCDKSNLVNSFDDRTAKRGFNYFYYIQTKDNGSTNDIEPGVPLVSNMFYTLTNREAFLRRPAAASLEEIRVVPNPYNIKAKSIQFGATLGIEDRLAFFGLPPNCVIKIFTEVGDLIQTINHVSGSGDELWDSKTSSNQLVVSGLYIAYFEVTQDTYDDQTGQLLFRKGENTFRKFIVIR